MMMDLILGFCKATFVVAAVLIGVVLCAIAFGGCASSPSFDQVTEVRSDETINMTFCLKHDGHCLPFWHDPNGRLDRKVKAGDWIVYEWLDGYPRLLSIGEGVGL